MSFQSQKAQTNKHTHKADPPHKKEKLIIKIALFHLLPSKNKKKKNLGCIDIEYQAET